MRGLRTGNLFHLTYYGFITPALLRLLLFRSRGGRLRHQHSSVLQLRVLRSSAPPPFMAVQAKETEAGAKMLQDSCQEHLFLGGRRLTIPSAWFRRGVFSEQLTVPWSRPRF